MSEVTVGTELPELRVGVTRSTVVRYSGASTDFNEIHFSDRHAQAIGLPGVVAHGMWTMGAGLKIVTDWVGDPARVLSYFVRFTRPVVVPDTDEGTEVVYAAKVTEVADGVAKLAITATCGDDAVLGAARAEVRLD
ncbi:MaoC/PaaZ C-terminal domain-containing protein [Tessaracoccus sp. ZS01]|uniref:MaoC/PaaZ C-terminal domain-containing protein n=1 Tax=Tessaracoccus sp. ZS01 TaxID=1906324 RepID=UPI00096EC298|nr:MaoC/PaaZ C-terminal domain-containing protein [Tessaracoccus sp. ZS01]MCG6567254.1 dehydratase [Tessaracoccus sp. ZS01]OMG57215.1 dehydratase [Tessaracoccus sp. ZS01]